MVVNQCDTPPGATELRSRIHNSIKTDENWTKSFKSPLIIQGHRDPEKARLSTKLQLFCVLLHC